MAGVSAMCQEFELTALIAPLYNMLALRQSFLALAFIDGAFHGGFPHVRGYVLSLILLDYALCSHCYLLLLRLLVNCFSIAI